MEYKQFTESERHRDATEILLKRLRLLHEGLPHTRH